MNKGSCELRHKLKSTQYEFLSNSEFYSNDLFNLYYLLNMNDLKSVLMYRLNKGSLYTVCILFYPKRGFMLGNSQNSMLFLLFNDISVIYNLYGFQTLKNLAILN